LGEAVTEKPLRRRRTWYKRQIRNRRIMAIIALLVVVGAGAWVVSSMMPDGDVESASPVRKRKMDDLVTPEKILQRAQQGDAEAQWKAGELYHNGDGVRQSDRDAVEWFQRSAEQKFVLAATALGAQYWAGEGVAQNYNKAYFWYDVALAEGDPNAESKLDELSGELTQDEVAAAHQQATAWLQAHGQKAQQR